MSIPEPPDLRIQAGDVWRCLYPKNGTPRVRRHILVEEVTASARTSQRWITAYAINPRTGEKRGPRSTPSFYTVLNRYELVERGGQPIPAEGAA